jgi:hypothetical protein
MDVDADGFPNAVAHRYANPSQRNIIGKWLKGVDFDKVWHNACGLLKNTEWSFGENTGLDDTVDTYYECSFDNTAKGREEVKAIVAGIIAREAEGKKCHIRRIEETDDHITIVVPTATGEFLNQEIPDIRVGVRNIEAGRSEQVGIV